MASKPTLGYWNVRGLASVSRSLLHHLGVDFEDKMYTIGDETPGTKWADVKPTLGLNFPNLPHFIDGDVQVTEHKAVLRSIARKYAPAYLGRTLAEEAVADQLTDVLSGVLMRLIPKLLPDTWAENLTEALVPVRACIE